MSKRFAVGMIVLVVAAVMAVPAYAAIKHRFGYVSVKNGSSSASSITFISDDHSKGSVQVQDHCPGDGHYVTVEIQVGKDGPDEQLGWASTEGHKCGYGTTGGRESHAAWFDHQRARLKVCRVPTGSNDPQSCAYSAWKDNPYD